MIQSPEIARLNNEPSTASPNTVKPPPQPDSDKILSGEVNYII